MSKLSLFLKCVPGLSGVFCILLGLTVIWGWWSRNSVLTSMLPNYIPVAFNVALIFALLGLSLLLSCKKEKRFCFLPVLLASGVVGLTALEYITGKSLLIDELFFKTPCLENILHPGRMAPNTLISLGLITLSQTLLIRRGPNKWISFLTLLLSQFACAIGWLSLLGYCLKLETSYHWVNLTPMALGTSIGIIVLSMGVLASGIKQEIDESTHFSYRYEILICLLGLFLTFSFWLALVNQEENHIRQLTQQRLLTFQAQLTEKLSARFNALNRIARRWAYSNGTNYEAWENDVKQYINDQPDYLSIGWVDSTYHTRWLYPKNETLLKHNLNREAVLNAVLKESQDMQKGLASPVLTLPNRQKEILYFSPIMSRNGQFYGFISGTYQLNELLESIISPNSSHYQVCIYENGNLIYGNPKDKRNTQTVKSSYQAFGLHWHIGVSPTSLMLQDVSSPLANMVLFIGIILSLFAAVLVNFINKIKKQSEQLHQSESNLDSTIQNSAIGLAVVSLEGKWLRINQALTSMLGYSEEELLQTSFQEITHPDDIDTDLNNVEQLLSDSFKNYQMEKRYLHKNGHYIWAQLNVSLIRDKNGNPQHFISQIQDITDRLKIETERKEQARRFQAIFNQTFEFIWLLTTEGIVLEANRAALSTVDIKEGAVIGQTFWETPWWIHSPALQDRLKQAIKDANNGESVWFEATYPTPEGRIITVDFSLKPMKDENNKVVLLISEGRDITENREKELLLQKSEEKLVEAYTELESAYQSLEAQLQERKAIEKQLLQAQKMDAIGTLTGGIAHDFNNILWMILGNTEMLMSELENDTFLLETTTDIHDAALRAKGLVKQLLDFSRKSESEKVQFDAAPLIKETIKMLRSSIPTSIVINTNISPECGLIYGDANKFHQVIVNLCTNAFHAIADQGSISISTQKKYIALEDVTEYIFKKPGHFLMVEVCDTGCGMSAETIERIFEPFFTTKEVGKGTGLGLSTVHGIVEEMEGFISVYSEMNQGSSFKVFIPIAKDEERKNTGHPSGGSGRTIARMAKHYQVMVVDDEEMIRKMLKRTLEQMGLSVTTFNNGKTALSAYLENSSGFDLIITDQTMPEMVGTNLAHAVRETNQKIPIIIASGNISIITEEEIKAASPLKLLSKPIQISELKRIIAEALDLEATVVKKEL